MIRSHRIQLKPRPKHVAYFKQACGTARYVWNWGLAKSKEEGFTSGFTLGKVWTEERPEWTHSVCRDIQNKSLQNLDRAYKSFFKKIMGYPKFKRRGEHDSFYIINQKLQLAGKLVRVPKLGWVKMTQELRYSGKIMSATVSREADRWFISISVEVPDHYESGEEIIGVDLGINHAVVLSTGEMFDAPRPLLNNLQLLKRRSKQLSRKVKGSNNREKAKLTLARLHRKIKNQRKDFLHRMTSKLVSRAKTIVIEDLDVKGMKFQRSILDIGFYEFRRQLEYKCQDLVIADRYFPSSQLCNRCGARKKMPLSERVYKCSCGYHNDRDVNAALNLSTLKTGESNAWGDETLVPSVNQESTNLLEV